MVSVAAAALPVPAAAAAAPKSLKGASANAVPEAEFYFGDLISATAVDDSTALTCVGLRSGALSLVENATNSVRCVCVCAWRWWFQRCERAMDRHKTRRLC